jgi:formylmethanofuran dehydrogenase subunit E
MAICERCGREMEGWETEWFGSKMVCYNCFQCELVDARRKAEEEAEECSHCGRKLPYWGYKEFQTKVYCPGCYDEAYRQYRRANSCTHCGKFIEKPGERFRKPSGELLCQQCFIDARKHFGMGVRAVRCALCKKDFPFKETVEWEQKRICTGCAEKTKGAKTPPPR